MSKDRNNRLDSLFSGAGKAVPGATPSPARPRVGAGAVGAAELNLLKDENTRLKAALEGAEIADIEIALIDPSPYPDRLVGDEETEGFTALKASLATRGQEVPILVRPHPNAGTRYQTVFGHRRLRALNALGKSHIRAAIRALSDEDLLLAQGIENSAREDLSWIEKALFAKKLEAFAVANGKDATQMVLDALSIHAPEASRYRKVLEAVDETLIQTIGPAPKIGRTKWQALAEILKADKKAGARIARQLKAKDFVGKTSDERFDIVLAAMNRAGELPAGNLGRVEEISNQQGEAIARFERRKRSTRIDVTDREFADFVREKLVGLYADFRGRTK
jgi:ParB family transcriptional regulator, chromosome partitioning protein